MGKVELWERPKRLRQNSKIARQVPVGGNSLAMLEDDSRIYEASLENVLVGYLQILESLDRMLDY